MRKEYFINDLVYGLLLIWILLVLTFCIIFSNSSALNTIFWIVLALLILVVTVLLLLLLFAKDKFLRKGLPAECVRNLNGCIEVHIGNTCDHNPFVFTKVCYKVASIAINEKSNILINTWIYTKEDITDRFGEAAEFLEPKSCFQECSDWITIQGLRLHNFIRKEKVYEVDSESLNKCFRCIICVEKLTSERTSALLQGRGGFKRKSVKIK